VPKSKPETAPDALKRERAGTYRSNDGRFTVEQSSSGWMVLDAEQTDGLGLPLARGPFGTLDDAKAAMAEARTAGAPATRPPKLTLVRPLPRSADEPPKRRSARPATGTKAGEPAGISAAPRRKPAPRAGTASPKPAPKGDAELAVRKPAPAIVIRELRGTDGDALRRLWKEAGFNSVGDDDRSLARMARRNPGLVLVAVEGRQIVASALGGWDGRRGWIYHVATEKTHRGQGIATRLLDQIEAALAVLGATKVNANVRDANEEGQRFWEARGYSASPSRPFGKEL
jgi:ribosomal protein S18 acetylase RimI-like enzyme